MAEKVQGQIRETEHFIKKVRPNLLGGNFQSRQMVITLELMN
jgi:hypothetical protein